LIKAIIVDDEAPARREMRRLLAVHPDIVIAGEAADVSAARGLALRASPDLVFLDIQLGPESGFDLLADLDSETAVLFVTAYDNHAVKAFEANALDYILKPVEPSRLAASLERVRSFRELRSVTQAKGTEQRAFSSTRWIYIDAGDAPQFVRTMEISFIEADGGGTIIHTIDGKSLHSSKSLTSWEQRLDGSDFVRVHRSMVVNLRHVVKIERWFQQSYRIHMRGASSPVPMSRRFATNLRELLG
jgi:two-component system, LytTR family, response regulator